MNFGQASGNLLGLDAFFQDRAGIMSKKWFYAHDGQVLGPFTPGEMKELAATGAIVPVGKIWAEGSDPKNAVAAATAIDFKALAGAPASPAPVAVQAPAQADEPAAPAEPVKVRLPAKKKKKLEPLKKKPALPAPAVPVAEPVAPLPAAAQPSESAGSSLSLPDLLRKARFALEQWVDEEDSVDVVLAGDMEVIKQDPALQNIFRPMQSWGKEVVDKLWKHLEFTVQNRRKYYLALVARKNQ
jgi:hypothetical protein